MCVFARFFACGIGGRGRGEAREWEELAAFLAVRCMAVFFCGSFSVFICGVPLLVNGLFFCSGREANNETQSAKKMYRFIFLVDRRLLYFLVRQVVIN